jgi:hypothetical protein
LCDLSQPGSFAVDDGMISVSTQGDLPMDSIDDPGPRRPWPADAAIAAGSQQASLVHALDPQRGDGLMAAGGDVSRRHAVPHDDRQIR